MLRGCLVGLLGVVVGLGVVGEVADVTARHVATSKIESRIRQAVPGASDVSVTIRSWPFLKVGVDGRVDDIAAHVGRVEEESVTFTDVVVELRGVRVSVTDLLTDLRVDVTSIASGDVSLVITDADLAQALHLPAAAATAANVAAVSVTVDAANRQLVVGLPHLAAVRVALPNAAILPCIPLVARESDAFSLSCAFDHVPAAFTSLTLTTPTPTTVPAAP
jgi:hypothetical protein